LRKLQKGKIREKMKGNNKGSERGMGIAPWLLGIDTSASGVRGRAQVEKKLISCIL